MPDELLIAEEVRARLVDLGVVSAAEDNVSSPPPCEIDPRGGAMNVELPPKADAIVTILTGQELPKPWLEGDFRQDRVIEFIVRAKTRPRAELLLRSLRALHEEQRAVMCGRLYVDEIKMWRGAQVIAVDKDSWTLSSSFIFTVANSKLTV